MEQNQYMREKKYRNNRAFCPRYYFTMWNLKLMFQCLFQSHIPFSCRYLRYVEKRILPKISPLQINKIKIKIFSFNVVGYQTNHSLPSLRWLCSICPAILTYIPRSIRCHCTYNNYESVGWNLWTFREKHRR